MKFNTRNPVGTEGSSDPRDMFDNAGNLDLALQSDAPSWKDRFGVDRPTYKEYERQTEAVIDQIVSDGAAAIDTLIMVSAGDFFTGTVVTARNQTVLWSTDHGGNGHEFRWAGALNKTVPAESSPLTTGGIYPDGQWIDVGVTQLRRDLAPVAGIKHLRKLPNIRQTTLSFHDGLGVGDGDYIWLPGADQSEHLQRGPNGGILWASAALDLYDGTRATLPALLNWIGTGTGCFELLESGNPHVTMFGAVPDYEPSTKTGTDNALAFNKMMQSFPVTEAKGDGKYLVLSEIAPNRKFLFNAEGATICQRTNTEPLFNLNGCSGSQIHFGDYTNDADIEEYDIDNARLIFASQYVEDISIYNAKIVKTFQQGINLNHSSARINIVLCHIEETARDGVFLLNSVDAKVSLCTLKNTGDDSIAFAGQSFNAIASSNTITGAGSYNLGGSGIRFNRSGVAVGNTITDSDLFGIIAADNSVDATAKPENLKLIGNTIKGINKTGTVTAGIGFKNVISVECISNDIEMPDNEAHAYRLYGATKSGEISISGGKIKNAKSVMYVRESGAESIEISAVKAKLCSDFFFLEATGQIDILELTGNTSDDTANAGYFRTLKVSGQPAATVLKLITKNNKLKNPHAVPFLFDNDTIINLVESTNDQWATNVYQDFANGAFVSEMYIDGRMGDRISAQGQITFNATNSDLISFGSQPLSRVPLKSEITLTLETSLGSATSHKIDFADSYNFRIYLNSAPGQPVTFSWKVKMYDKRKVK
ncbi:hypothetical protein [Rheinheimera sp. 1928-s]|uniref:tail fiber/spike domain-containing protein n=1 Tax=Rheinheimera sp. 1928-s TaxID=3033803 RepID=UPI0026279731|nr:hypothetical protein [Rheinheimera sp. 1928-s]MDF3127389.1 hypothetical protein [Rheinheimera sp. 1928-s]